MVEFQFNRACISLLLLVALSGVAGASNATPSIQLKQVDRVDLLAGSVLLRAELLRADSVKISRIAHGVPLGGELEYVDGSTLAHALSGRRVVESE